MIKKTARKRGSDDEDDTHIIRSVINSFYIVIILISHLQITQTKRKADNENNYVSGSAATTVFESTNDATAYQYGGGATSYSEIDTSIDRDARSILERNMKLTTSEQQNSSDPLYRGHGAYQSYTKQDSSQIGANKFTG